MKFKRLLALLMLPLLILLGSTASYSAMYKYQDEQGNWVYSQRPPANGDYKTIKAQKASRSSSLSKDARKAKIIKARESVIGTPESRKEKDKVAQETAKNAATRRDSCEKSKKALASLQVYRRFRDKDGNVTRLNDDDRAQRTNNAKQNIEQFCD